MGEINYGKNLANAFAGMERPYKKLEWQEKERKEKEEDKILAVKILGDMLLKRREIIEKRYLGSVDEAGHPVYEYKTFKDEDWESRPIEKFIRKSKELFYPTESSFGKIDDPDDDYFMPRYSLSDKVDNPLIEE